MKKFLAVIMSMVMVFALAAMPVCAAEAETETKTEETIKIEDVVNALILTVELVQSTLVEVHNIVGSIMGMLDKTCPMCEKVHDVAVEDTEGEEVESDTTLDDFIGGLINGQLPVAA